MSGQPPDLPPPAVPAAAYDEPYYRCCAAGYEEWERTGGGSIGGIYAHVLERTGFAAGQTLVDLGCGRGELVALAAGAGARRAVGVEYAAAAVEIARRTFAAQGVSDRAEIILADARAVPVASGTADLVTMLDVVEHLTPAELDAALGEAMRILRPGGRLLIHTFPNRAVYEVTYRLQRLAHPGRWRRWPANPRNEHERLMHVNEQTPRRLAATLRRAGFADVRAPLGRWVYTDFVPEPRARRLYERLARHRPTAGLAVGNMFGEALRPG